jgi:hypothetical protein
MPKRQLHLGIFTYPGGHHIGGWRHGSVDPTTILGYDYYRRTAMIAERGKFDLPFVGDMLAAREKDGRVLAQGACCLFDWRQGNAGLGASGIDLVADQANAQQAAARAEHRDPIRRHPALAQRHFAADVMEAAIERRQAIGMALQDLVMDGDGADDARQPPLAAARRHSRPTTSPEWVWKGRCALVSA